MPVQTMSQKSAEEKWVNRPRRREADPYIRLLEMVCLMAKRGQLSHGSQRSLPPESLPPVLPKIKGEGHEVLY